MRIVIGQATREHYLYHNTSAVWLDSILLRFKAVGVPSDFDSHKGYQTLKKGWVSFSRSSRYRAAPGAGRGAEVRLVFDYAQLKKRYKILPYADNFVAPAEDRDGFIREGYRLRWESEERVLGPVYLKDGLVRVEVLESVVDELKSTKQAYQGHRDLAIEGKRQLKLNKFWHNGNGRWESFDDYPKARRTRTDESYDSGVRYWTKEIERVDAILNYPKLVTVTSFK